MGISRRMLLGAAGTMPLWAGTVTGPALAQAAPAAAGPPEIPAILFVHGNGDHAALWITTLWRMESNGVPRERMFAINFTDPLARSDDAMAQPNRSSTADQRRELSAAIRDLKQRTGASRVALVGNSRGGYSIRSVIRDGGAADVSHAVLCGVPNHGVFDWEDNPGSEFNGRGPFLRELNAGDSEVTPGTAFLTLRSNGMDKYAQADGRFLGKPGVATNVGNDGPSLKGATNLMLGTLDHREVAFHPRAFREIYRFIAGREPSRIEIVPEAAVKLSGLVTAMPGGVPTNRPVGGATVEIYHVSPESGERLGGPIHSSQTGADGRWGPANVEPSWYLEMVLTSPGAPVTHFYRSPFPRSSDVVHLRPAKAPGPADAGAASVVIMTRPRGYFGLPRDVILLDGKEPADVKAGVPTDSTATLRLAAGDVGRPVVTMFNQERIVVRAWPVSENRIVMAELTY